MRCSEYMELVSYFWSHWQAMGDITLVTFMSQNTLETEDSWDDLRDQALPR